MNYFYHCHHDLSIAMGVVVKMQQPEKNIVKLCHKIDENK